MKTNCNFYIGRDTKSEEPILYDPDITQVAANPLKKDILVELFGVAWLPYHVVEAGGRTEELAGYGSGK
jgi:hypothetical protein